MEWEEVAGDGSQGEEEGVGLGESEGFAFLCLVRDVEEFEKLG